MEMNLQVDFETKRTEKIVEIKDLRVEIDTGFKKVYAVNGVSFDIYRGEFVALVGESGCGKSLTALSLIGLSREIAGARVSGAIYLRRSGNVGARVTDHFTPSDSASSAEGLQRKGVRFGRNGSADELLDIVSAPLSKVQRIRGKEIAMIFQDPMSSLNPVLRVGEQLMEPLIIHKSLSRAEARKEAINLLRLVRIDDPEQRFFQYPHQLSGGMRQRVMIAMAVSAKPSLIIADEPTTALDVTIQAQILELLAELKAKFSCAVMLITHNLAIVAGIAGRVFVMYAGKIVESTSVRDFFKNPRHPYSRALLRSIPRADKKSELISIPGQPPEVTEPITHCPFAPRCERAQSRCFSEMPELEQVGASLTACFFPY